MLETQLCKGDLPGNSEREIFRRDHASENSGVCKESAASFLGLISSFVCSSFATFVFLSVSFHALLEMLHVTPRIFTKLGNNPTNAIQTRPKRGELPGEISVISKPHAPTTWTRTDFLLKTEPFWQGFLCTNFGFLCGRLDSVTDPTNHPTKMVAPFARSLKANLDPPQRPPPTTT